MKKYLNDNKLENYYELVGWAQSKDHVLLYKIIKQDVEKDKYGHYENIKVKEIRYKFYDVGKRNSIKKLKTNGYEYKKITAPGKIIYKPKGKNTFKRFELKNN